MQKRYTYFSTAIFLVLAMFLLNGCDDDCASPEDLPGQTIVIEEHSILSSNYLNNQFFFLDLPPYFGVPVHDVPGRDPSALIIDPSSIAIFQLMGAGVWGPNDVQNVAAYIDSTGVFWSTGESPAPDFSDPYLYGPRWREVDFEFILDIDGGIVAVDLGRQMAPQDVFAVTYDVISQDGQIHYKIGDRPGWDDDDRIHLPNEEGPYYRMKILKAPEDRQEPFTFFYVLRNIYSLGFSHIDIDSVSLKIERNDNSSSPELDENAIPYIQLFGLDKLGQDGSLGPDGFADFMVDFTFDLERGLLFFPLIFPQPFNASEDIYADYANDDNFQWEGTFLQENQAPELYDPETLSLFYPGFGFFKIVVQQTRTAEQ